jgi:hypothetical protein
MKTVNKECKDFFRECRTFLSPSKFVNGVTSRTVRSTRLSTPDVYEATRRGKFIHKPHINEPLPPGFHAVNVFTRKEMKRRRRIITEPHLNSAFPKERLPRTRYRSRLARRQQLRKCRYMLQLDFEAFYDAIPLPPEAEEKFVFKKGKEFYALRTLPTGATWSVCVGQSITWVICDFPRSDSIVIQTMIDNMLVAGEEGNEAEFVHAVRTLCQRTIEANLQTSPPAQDILRMSDRDILRLAMEPNTFLGEEYVWTGGERKVRNGIKTVAKLNIMSKRQSFSFRTFAGLVSLILYAAHTVAINAAVAFHLLRAYRGVGKQIALGKSWDDPMPFISSRAQAELRGLLAVLCKNELAEIRPPKMTSYADETYDNIIFIDASRHGWGALRRTRSAAWIYQQHWENSLGGDIEYHGGSNADKPLTLHFAHSAHAEPTAIIRLLKHIAPHGDHKSLGRTAIVTDHYAIVQAQIKENGFGGIGRGAALNALFAATNESDISFFYVPGPCNPADYASRNFPISLSPSESNYPHHRIHESCVEIALPLLRETFSPLCEHSHPLEVWKI